jgi:hypothetical protein
MAQLQKGQSYPELGFKVDSKGIAYDLTTGQSLAKADVDGRLAGTGTTQLTKDRGGVAGFYDDHKNLIPIAQGALAMLPGIGPLASAGMGALRGFDRPGQGGIGYDAGTGLKGAATGYAAGAAGDMLGKALGIGQTLGGAAKPPLGTPGTAPSAGGIGGILGKVGGAVGALPGLGALGGGATGGSNPFGSIGDFLGGNNGLNALATAQTANAALLGKQSSEYAKNAMKTQDDLWAQRAPLRDQGISGMQKAPVALPQLGAMSRAANPFGRTA